MNCDKNPIDLSHLFENCGETSVTGEDGRVVGQIPDWLKGSMYTVGPGKYTIIISGFTVQHIADGYAVFCKFSISKGQVRILKRYEQSDALKKAKVAGRTVLPELFTKSSPDVTRSRLSRMTSLFPENSDNCNHSIFLFADKLLVTNGFEYFREIDPNDLTSGEKHDVDKLFGLNSFCPHPVIEDDGTLYTAGGAVWATGAKQVIIKIPPTLSSADAKNDNNTSLRDLAKAHKVISTVAMPGLMVFNVYHSISMTENFLVLIAQPFMFNAKKLLGIALKGGHAALMDAAEWHPDHQNKFIIIEKKTGKIQKFHAVSNVPFYYLHYVNSFELKAKDAIIVDLITHRNPNHTMEEMLLKNLKSGNCCDPANQGRIQRFIVPLHNFDEDSLSDAPAAPVTRRASVDIEPRCINVSHLLTPANISERGIYSAIINPNFKFKCYRFIYANSGFDFQGHYAKQIVKFDLETAEEDAYTCPDDVVYAEPIFIPRPHGSGEDDGVLACGAYSLTKNKPNFLLILDAKSMTEMSRVYFDTLLPYYSHGIFLP